MNDTAKKDIGFTTETATDAAETAANDTAPSAEKGRKKKDTGVYTHKFKTPFEYEGVTYTELTFNFERLKGRDMVAIENEMQDQNEYALAAEISSSFRSKMAARAAGIGSDVLEAMPMKDFNAIIGAARNFLLDTGL